MMQKAKVIFSALLIFLVSLSIGGVWHYCGDNLAQFKLTLDDSKADCGMQACQLPNTSEEDSQNNCCTDITVQYNTDNYHVPASPALNCVVLISFTGIPSSTDTMNGCDFHHRNFCYNHPPDTLFSVDLNDIQVYLI